MTNTKDGELVYVSTSLPGGHELMIRRYPDGQAYDYWLYVNGARAYGPYWRAADAYKRLKQLGGTWMATKTVLTADKPRGKNQRARWYETHARPAEELLVIELPNGRIGMANGGAVVSTDRAALDVVVDRFWPTYSSGAARWRSRSHTFEEGARVTRVNTVADARAL